MSVADLQYVFDPYTRCSSFHDPGLYLPAAFSHKLCETTYLA